MDLLRTTGYNLALNRAALWMLVISPLQVVFHPIIADKYSH